MDQLNELVADLPHKIQNLMNQGILRLLDSPGMHSADEMQRKISAALQVVPQRQKPTEVFVFSVGSPESPSYFVAYNVEYCAICSRAWVGLVGRTAGRYEILSEGDDSSAGRSLNVTQLDKAKSGSERFLVYGTNWGDAHSRLTAIAYVLEHAQLVKLWSRTELPQGAINVSGKEITLKFLTKLERPPTAERTEIYVVEPEGIQLKEGFERPI